MFALRKYRLFELLDDLTSVFLGRAWFIVALAVAVIVALVVFVLLLEAADHEPISHGIFLTLIVAPPALGVGAVVLYKILHVSEPLYKPADEARTRRKLARAAIIKQRPEFAGTHPALLDALYGIE